MNKKKLKVLCVLASLLAVLLAACFVLKIKSDREAEALRIYHETYLVMDGAEYLRASTELDLSGKQITELEKLLELTALKKLNLRDTGITAGQYDMLRAGLPACEILWSVPFQNSYYDDDVQELTLDTLSTDDLPMLAYMTELTTVNADSCRDFEALLALVEQYPTLDVTYSVPIGDTAYPQTQNQLTVTDPDADQLMKNLALLPMLENVTLEGNLPSTDKLIALKEQYPNITFLWNFSVCGVQTNTLAEKLNLSNIQMADTTELENALPCFYNLKKVEMIKCGLSNPDMEALNMRHPKTKFVWTVTVCGVTLRTDTKHFMPYHYGIKTPTTVSNLRYCTEIEVLDFGHKGVHDISYLEYMPNLRYLLMLDTPLEDLSIVGNCTSLEFVEIASTRVTDFWPLTNLTNMKMLNLSYTPYYGKVNGTRSFGTFGDITPLYQMTWLDRLWLTGTRLGEERRSELRAALPNVEMVFMSVSATDKGWRYSPGYYEMRDILGMFYQYS